MRRKNRYIVNGATIGFAITSIADVLIQWNEHRISNLAFTWESYNGARTIKSAFWGGVVGGGIGYASYLNKIREESKLPFNQDTYLKNILTKENLNSDPDRLAKIISAKNRIKSWLGKVFKSKLVHFPEDGGSFFKGTALASDFDLDVILPFKKRSFETLEKMYYTVYKLINDEFGEHGIVCKQSKSIGLSIVLKGESIHFDIVPGREVNDYKIDRDLNLYIRPERFWQKGSQFKTNSRLQKKIAVNNPKARAVIKLLKKYARLNSWKVPAIIIEQFTIEALSENKYGIQYSTAKNFLSALIYISSNIIKNTLIDSANSNNNLLDKLTVFEQHTISRQIRKDLIRIREDPRNLKLIF